MHSGWRQLECVENVLDCVLEIRSNANVGMTYRFEGNMVYRHVLIYAAIWVRQLLHIIYITRCYVFKIPVLLLDRTTVQRPHNIHYHVLCV
jgi:hypothetical protein